MPSYEIPQEIIDAILDHLPDDMPTLQNCSLVSRSFFTLSRMHLFSHVSLLSEAQCKRLHYILVGNPHIGPIVRHLSAEDPEPACKQWYAYTSVLPLILPMLPRLQSLKIRGGSGTLIFPGVGTAMGLSLLAAFQPPGSLTSLTLGRIFFSMHQLRRCRNLQSLTLVDYVLINSWAVESMAMDSPGDNIVPSENVPHLTSLVMEIPLRLNIFSRITTDPHFSLNLSHLHTFEYIICDWSELARAWTIILNAAASITAFKMHIMELNSIRPVNPNPFNIGLLPQLNSIHLIFSSRKDFNWLPHLFGSVSAENKISLIQLRFDTMFWTDLAGLCSELDSIFSQTEYKCLMGVKVSLANGIIWDALPTFDLKDHFCYLHSRGLLHVDILPP